MTMHIWKEPYMTFGAEWNKERNSKKYSLVIESEFQPSLLKLRLLVKVSYNWTGKEISLQRLHWDDVEPVQTLLHSGILMKNFIGGLLEWSQNDGITVGTAGQTFLYHFVSSLHEAGLAQEVHLRHHLLLNN